MTDVQEIELPQFEILFEADSDAEEELAGEEIVDPELITDQDIGSCRITGCVECVEYGQLEEKPGALLVFAFNFHNFKTHFRSARICVTFQKADGSKEGIVRYLVPECQTWAVSQTNVKRTIQGGLTLGKSSLNLSGGASCSTESTRSHRVHIHGSGNRTSRVVWTLEEENAEAGNRVGIPGQFITALLVQMENVLSASVSVTASIGFLHDSLRRIKSKKPKDNRYLRFDGVQPVGRRPSWLVIAPEIFRIVMGSAPTTSDKASVSDLI